MLVLFETPGGLALFNVLDEKKIRNVDDLWQSFETQAGAQKM
jgi:nucleolar protein 58